MPDLPRSLADVNTFPARFDKYYLDHFGLRNQFNQYYSWLKFSLGDSPSDMVLIGKNGWLFLGPGDYDDPIGDVRNVNLYSEKALEELGRYLDGMSNWLKSKDIEFLLFVAPNKHTIYFDQLPAYITKVNDKSATDQLYEYLKKNTDVTVIDLRESLLRGKAGARLYYKTGTHWNFFGGNIAQYEIIKVIEHMFPGKISAELYDKSIFQYLEATDRGLEELAAIKEFMPAPLEPYPVFEPGGAPQTEPQRAKRITDGDPNQQLSAIVFRDSFFRCLEPYFNRKFRKTIYRWTWPNYSDLIRFINSDKPDIVIVEFVERQLPANY